MACRFAFGNSDVKDTFRNVKETANKLNAKWGTTTALEEPRYCQGNKPFEGSWLRGNVRGNDYFS